MNRLAFLSLALLLAACDRGKLTLSLADAPVDDADTIRLEITGVELERADGEFEIFDFAAPIVIENALDLQGGATKDLLDEVRLPAEDYVGIRVNLNASGDEADSSITLKGGGLFGLEQEDDDPAEIEQGFTIERDEHLKLVVDFDLRRSILPQRENAPQDAPYRLRPVLRLANRDTAGGIVGTVDAALLPEGCVPAVYVFSGSGITPDDAGSGASPLTSAIVRDGAYAIAFVPPGSYTAAFTCDADADDPSSNDDDVIFDATATDADVSVATQQTATVNFPPAP